MSNTKTCPRCKQTLPVSGEHWYIYKSGRQCGQPTCYCKACSRAKSKEYATANPDKVRKYQRRYAKRAQTAAKAPIQPLGDRILVQKIDLPDETVTDSGIVIPTRDTDRPVRGRVLAVGPGKADTPLRVRVGQEVLFGKYAGTAVELDGQAVTILREDEVLGILA